MRGAQPAEALDPPDRREAIWGVDARLVLAGIVLLATVVRLAGIGDRLSDAEGYSWLVASSPSIDVFFDRLAAYENTPPLFYALLTPLPLGDEAWLRLPALISSVACVPALYALVRPLLGTTTALLAALALAAAPFHVSYANYSRGFMLASLGTLLAAWAVARLAQGRTGRWWGLYFGGATLAVHSEYDSVLLLAPLLAMPALWRRRGAWETAAVGVLPLLTLLPLAGEMARGIDQIDVTKLTPPSPGLSIPSLRDSLVSLFTGTNGLAAAAGLRALQAIAILAALLACALWLRRASRIPPADRDVAFWLLAVAPATAALLHVLVSLVGPDVFDARYLTALIPFAVALLAYGVTALSWRWASPATAVALIALATAVVAQRHDREIHPDLAPVAAAVRSSGATTVLTNSSAVAYYLRDQGARLDRPFGLSDDEPECALRCPKPLAIVDDVTLPGSARIGKGQIQRIGPIVVRVRP